MPRLLIPLCFSLLSLSSNAQALQDTIHPNGKRGRATIQVIPCPCDSNKMDSFVMMPVEFDDIQKNVVITTVIRYDQQAYCFKSVETICWQKAIRVSSAENRDDTVLGNGRHGSYEYIVLPVLCDSVKMIYRVTLPNVKDDVNAAFRDTMLVFYRYSFCLDTLETIIWQKSILDIADSLSLEMNVPPQLVYEIGLNESKWQRIYDFNYLIKFGDLQVIDRTFHHFYNHLGLKGGKTRINYLIVGIYYLRMNFEQQGSWRKARYTYGRGFWKPPNQWTSIERKFMNRIDWAKYD